MSSPEWLERSVRKLSQSLLTAASELGPLVQQSTEGRVIAQADRVLTLSGLPNAASHDLLEFRDGSQALVLELEKSSLSAVLLDDRASVSVGDWVRGTGRQPRLAVGDGLLGRVIDPLGRPLDGRPLTALHSKASLERRAPQLYERAELHQPLFTGVLAIDALFPVGRGQRELILGDEGTGKTTLAVDCLVRQARTDVVGVYVAIARRSVDTWRVVETLRANGGRWIVVAASDDGSPGLRYLAPYAGMAVAEFFAGRGEHALVVLDDLTAHAVAWRELSLLVGRPPSREAYPGDIFYQHSRLLERGAQLSVERGGGSVTVLPLAALQGGRLTGYIPTNLISITDGQIVLSRDLFTLGQMPAIEASLSVSRVGSRVQPQALRDLSSKLRLEYAGFLELESFSRLGARLEARVERRLAKGRRLRRLLRAERLEPLGVFDEVLRLLLADEEDLLLRFAEGDIQQVAVQLCAAARNRLAALVARIEQTAVLSESDRHELVELIRSRAELLGASVTGNSAAEASRG